MAIKIFSGGSLQEIEDKVNGFMKERGQNLPVRTNVIGDAKAAKFVATVFYNETFEQKVPEGVVEEVVTDSYNKPSSDKIGALWTKGENLSGTIEIEGTKGKVEYTKQKWDELETVDTKAGDKMKLGSIGNIKFRIIANKFKTESKHPDFVIMRSD